MPISAVQDERPRETGELVIHQALQTPMLVVQVRAYRWREPVADARRVTDHWLLDLSLTSRPGEPRGRYLERWRGGRSEPIGDVLFLPPTLEFSGSHGAGRQTSLSLLLAPQLLQLAVDDLDEARLAEGLHLRDAGIRSALWRLAAEVAQQRLETPALIEAAAISIAAEVERRIQRAPGTCARKRGGLPPARLRLIEERLRARLPPPRMAELASLCGLSERQLARAYRQETGESIGVRVASATRQRAWALLTQTEHPIGAVARELGFASSASFAAAFRNSTGCRPSDVRRCAI
ncbi:MAG: helix-turn-helix domain protein [Phenylobacterium sp.]|nr:helix-turn-helix domain protein [Phenylobacterium sp.]